MSNGDDIIICGSGGQPVTDKTITVYDAPVSIAIKIDKHALELQSIAEGMDPEKAARRVERFVKIVENDYYRWGEYLEDRLCIGYERHTPHPQ